MILFLFFSCNYSEKNNSENLKTVSYTSDISILSRKEWMNKILIEHKSIKNFVHPSWFNDPISFEFKELEDIDRIRNAEEAIYQAFSQYPSQVLIKHIGVVALLKEIKAYGEKYGATYVFFKGYPNSSGIYIALEDHVPNEELSDYIIDSLHHEFSSIIMKSDKFPDEQWRSLNLKSFKYKHDNRLGGVDALKSREFGAQNDKKILYLQGFLSQYAMTNVEEDFNVYSGMIMTHPYEVKNLIIEYPIVRKKVKLWLDFYKSIDQEFKDTTVFQILEDA